MAPTENERLQHELEALTRVLAFKTQALQTWIHDGTRGAGRTVSSWYIGQSHRKIIHDARKTTQAYVRRKSLKYTAPEQSHTVVNPGFDDMPGFKRTFSKTPGGGAWPGAAPAQQPPLSPEDPDGYIVTGSASDMPRMAVTTSTGIAAVIHTATSGGASTKQFASTHEPPPSAADLEFAAAQAALTQPPKPSETKAGPIFGLKGVGLRSTDEVETEESKLRHKVSLKFSSQQTPSGRLSGVDEADNEDGNSLDNLDMDNFQGGTEGTPSGRAWPSDGPAHNPAEEEVGGFDDQEFSDFSDSDEET